MRYGVLDGPNRRPIGGAVVKLLARAAVHGDEVSALGLRPSRQFRRVERGVIPAEPHFHAHGNFDRADGRGDQPAGLVQISHQGGAGEPASDPFAWTAHIDVDPARAGVFGVARRESDPFRVARGDLNDAGSRLAFPRAGEPQPCLPVVAGNARGGDHFAKRRAGAMTLGDPPHGRVGDAGHRREEGAARDREPANCQRRVGAGVAQSFGSCHRA